MGLSDNFLKSQVPVLMVVYKRGTSEYVSQEEHNFWIDYFETRLIHNMDNKFDKSIQGLRIKLN